MSFPKKATAYSPGSIGNLGPGLDILGCALEGAGDTVTAEFSDSPGIKVLEPGHPALSSDPSMHASAIAAHAVIRRATHMGATTPAAGIALRVSKGLPLSAGQGGSAASAVAGAAAVNALIGSPLSRDEILEAALYSETQLAGRHLDNIAPSYMGGIVLIRSLDPIDVQPIPVPEALHIVLACPEQKLRTAEARAVLPVEVALTVALHQAAQVGGIVAALHAGDRAGLLPGFSRAKQAAMGAGALGVSISGAGPTAFALCGSTEDGDRIATAMRDAYRKAGLECNARVTRPDRAGTRIETAA
jgi:homoserine kinase